MKVYLYKKKAGKCWFAKFSYVDEFGNQKQKSISTGISKYDSKKEAKEVGKQLAAKFIDEIEAKKNRLTSLVNHISHCDDSIEAYSKYWLQCLEGSVRPNTLKSYSEIVEGHIIPILGNYKLSDLTQFHLKGFIDEELRICDERERNIAERLSINKNATIRTSERSFRYSIGKHLATIRMMLEYAYNDGDVTENAAKKINKQYLKKIPKSTFESIPYTAEEIKTLKKAIKGHILEVPVVLGACLGLRRSEILGLKWTDIDFIHNTIHIRNSCVLVGTKATYRDNLVKTDKSKSVMPLTEDLRRYLLGVLKQQEENKKVLGSGYNDSDYICRWPDGTLIKPNYISQGYHKFLRKNNLRPTRFHDLRHSVGTIILEKNHDIKQVQEILRQSDIRTTANIYTQPNLGYMEDGLNSLSTPIEDDSTEDILRRIDHKE